MTTSLKTLAKTMHRAEPLVQSYLGDEATAQARAKILKAMEQERPRILVYGAYNAGKSTLINVLLDQEAAPTGEIPVTDSVTSFPWEDAELLDTPGVNAPIQHEQITEATLQDVFLVLFVVRQGDQDAADIYRRIFELCGSSGKHLFIVLNHETENPESRNDIYLRLRDLLMTHAALHGLDDNAVSKIPVFPVNLATAWKARKKQSAKLLEHSGFCVLEEELRKWKNEHNTDRDRTHHIARLISSMWIDPVLAQIGRNQQENAIQSTLEKRKSDLLKEKETLQNELMSKLHFLVNSHHAPLRSRFEQCLHNRPNDAGCLEDAAWQTSTEILDAFRQWLTEKLQEAPVLNANFTFHFSQAASTGGLEIPPEIKTVLSQTLANREVLKETFLFLRKMKVPYFKGRWGTTLGKWAGRASMALYAIFAIWEVYSSIKKQEEDNRRQRELMIEINNLTHQVLDEIHSTLKEQSLEIIDNCYDGPIADVEKALQQIVDQMSKLDRDAAQLRDIQMELNALAG